MRAVRIALMWTVATWVLVFVVGLVLIGEPPPRAEGNGPPLMAFPSEVTAFVLASVVATMAGLGALIVVGIRDLGRPAAPVSLPAPAERGPMPTAGGGALLKAGVLASAGACATLPLMMMVSTEAAGVAAGATFLAVMYWRMARILSPRPQLPVARVNCSGQASKPEI